MIRGIGTILFAGTLIAGGYFSGAFSAAAPKPAAATADAGAGAGDASGGEDMSRTPYSDEECAALKDKLASENFDNPDLQTRPDSLGQAMRQTAVTVVRLKQMERELRRHDCIKDGDSGFKSPKAEMLPADPSYAPQPQPEATPFGSARN